MLTAASSAGSTATDPSKVTTPRGIGIGATADEVRTAYGEELEAEPDHYLDLPAEYLTFWLKPGKRGPLRNRRRAQGRKTIHAGNDSIQLIEGCA